MKYRRILGLGTFPIVKPIHGGQRRVEAFSRFYESIGIRYDHACVYDATIYPRGVVGVHDLPMGPPPAEYRSIPYIADLLSGWQAANDPASFRHFMGVIEAVNPDALQLEHPFMWPLVDQVLRRTDDRNLPVIYSSHNVESPLKRSILRGAGVSPDVTARIHDEIEKIELEACLRSALIVCVSKLDRDYYLGHRSEADIIVVPNGVDRSPSVVPAGTLAREVFGDNRFLLMVGSAYPPNVEGACELVMQEGAFHCPPIKTLAVCGGMSDGIRLHPEYQRFAVANGYRVHFFPSIEDDDLLALKEAAHGLVLAVGSGGGTSLKTAEALALGKWVIANSHALRGFGDFADAEGVIKADNRTDFRRAMAKILRSDPIEISALSRQEREVLFWDRCFSDSGLTERLTR